MTLVAFFGVMVPPNILWSIMTEIIGTLRTNLKFCSIYGWFETMFAEILLDFHFKLFFYEELLKISRLGSGINNA